MKKKAEMESRIPFAGFYSSMWDGGIDNEHESHFEWLKEQHDISHDDHDALNEWMWRNSKHRLSYLHIAKEYVEPFQNFINEGLGLNISLSFHDMTSPREYNFETDKIFVGLSYRDALILARRVGRNALRKAAKAMFTSRDGFISFYRSDPAEWGRLRGWDHNQLYCLFHAAVDVIGDEDYEWSIYEDMSGNGDIGTAFQAAFDSDELLVEVGRLKGRRELIEELENEKEEDDGRRFPSQWYGTEDYVAKYHKLNSNSLYEGDL